MNWNPLSLLKKRREARRLAYIETIESGRSAENDALSERDWDAVADVDYASGGYVGKTLPELFRARAAELRKLWNLPPVSAGATARDVK